MQAKSAETTPKYSPDWISRIDGRTAIGRAANQRMASLVDAMGGQDHVSPQRMSLAKRAVWLEILIEQRELAVADGAEIDERSHVASINALTGLLKTIGLERVAREFSLSDYLAKREAAQ